MASFTAGTIFVDGVSNDVTAAKLGNLVTNATPTSGFIQDRTAETIVATNDTLLIGDASDSNNLKRITVANFAQTLPTAKVTTGTIETGTFGTTTSTAATITTGTIPTLVATTLVTTGTGTAAAPAIVPTGDTNTGFFFPAADTIAFAEGGAEAMRIDSSGRVGIGTTSADSIFHIKDNVAVLTIEGSATSSASVQFKTNTINRYKIATPDSSADLAFYSSGTTERIRIDSSGNVLVGTTTAGGGAGYNTRFAVYSSTVDPHISVADTGATITGPYIAWHKAASGNNIFMSFTTESSITLRGLIDYNRGSSVVRYNTTSDETLKNIIGDSSGSESVNILKNTRIRDFTWKNDTTNKVNVGVIAQELHEVFKGAVSVGGDIVKKDSDGNDVTIYQPWGVDKTAFTFHLVAGWKAHEKLIQELKSENDSLKSRIEALEAA